MSNITFVLFTFNEEHRIEYIVRNLRPYGEVFLLDGGSTDKTQEIGEKFGAKFFLRPDRVTVQVENQANFDFIKSIVKTPWIFWSYVDNFLPKALLKKLTEVSKQDKFKSVYVPIDTYLFGDTVHPIIRASYACFFQKEYMDFSSNRIHGMGKFTGNKDEVLHIPVTTEYAMKHFSLYDLTKFVQGHVRYAEPEARDRIAHGEHFSFWHMLASMANYFRLFYRRGYKAGIKGFFAAMLYTFFRFMVWMRVYEIENGQTLESIEADFAKEKKRMVEEVESK